MMLVLYARSVRKGPFPNEPVPMKMVYNLQAKSEGIDEPACLCYLTIAHIQLKHLTKIQILCH